MLKCDLSSVHNWTKAGILKLYGLGGRKYYKLSEIELAIVPLSNRKNRRPFNRATLYPVVPIGSL